MVKQDGELKMSPSFLALGVIFDFAGATEGWFTVKNREETLRAKKSRATLLITTEALLMTTKTLKQQTTVNAAGRNRLV